jgi:hypothetical protein
VKASVIPFAQVIYLTPTKAKTNYAISAQLANMKSAENAVNVRKILFGVRRVRSA